MKNTIWKEITKAEFLIFLKTYPRTLEGHRVGICDPPIESWNDFSLGKWPESMVGRIVLNEAMKGHPAYNGELNTYWILE